MIGFYHLDIMIRTNKRQMDKTGHCSCKFADTQEDMSPCSVRFRLRPILVTDTDVGLMMVMMIR